MGTGVSVRRWPRSVSRICCLSVVVAPLFLFVNSHLSKRPRIQMNVAAVTRRTEHAKPNWTIHTQIADTFARIYISNSRGGAAATRGKTRDDVARARRRTQAIDAADLHEVHECGPAAPVRQVRPAEGTGVSVPESVVLVLLCAARPVVLLCGAVVLIWLNRLRTVA